MGIIMASNNPLSAAVQRANRQTTERARQATRGLELVDQLLKEWVEVPLAGNPSCFHERAACEPVVSRLKTTLSEQLTSPLALRPARKRVAWVLEHLNSESGTAFPVPPPLLEIRSPSSLYTTAYINDQRRLQDFHEVMVREVLHQACEEADSPTTSLYIALYSAATFGGLCTADELLCLYRQLVTGMLPTYDLQRNRTWIELSYPSKKAHNVRVDDESHRMRRWYPDSVSLAFMVRYIRSVRHRAPGNEQISGSLPVKEFFSHLSELAGTVFPFNALSRFAKAGIGIAESLPKVDLPQLLMEYAVGRLDSVSLPGPNWLLYSGSQRSIDTSLKPLPQVGSQPSKLKHKARSENLARYERRLIGLLNDTKNDRALTRFAVLKRLEAFLGEDLPLLIRFLADWYYHLLWTRNLKPGTPARYHHYVAPGWLARFDGIDVQSLTSDDFWDHYSLWISETKSKGRAKLAGRLDDFHQFLASERLVPVLPGQLKLAYKNKTFVRARVVPEWLFDQALKTIHSLELDSHQKMCFAWMLTLSFRLGLRISEVTTLCVGDIEPGPEPNLFIHSNKFGSIKNGLPHRLPLYAMLTTAEFTAFEAWTRARRLDQTRSGELLFCPAGAPTTLWSAQQFRQFVTSLLSQISGAHFTPHDFRHTVANRLFWIGECGDTIDDCPYTEAEIVRIRAEIFTQRIEPRDRYWHLGAVFNHAGPSETFLSYVHTCDLMLHRKISQGEIWIPSNVASRLIGTRLDGVSQLDSGIGGQLVNFNQATALIYNNAKQCFVLPDAKAQGSQSNQKANQNIRSILETPVIDTTDPVELAFYVLRDLERGSTIEGAAYAHGKDYAWVTHFRRALAMYSAQTTKKGKLRHISEARLAEGKQPLGPARPNELSERALVGLLVKGLLKVHQTMPQLFADALDYWVKHTHSSGSEIRFRDPKELKRFLSCFDKVEGLGDHRWLALITPTADRSLEKLKAIWQLRPTMQVRRSSQAILKRVERYPYGNVHLHLLADPPVKQKGDRKQSSKALRYVMSMLWILSRVPGDSAVTTQAETGN